MIQSFIAMLSLFTLQKLRHTESDRLAVQVHAYLDNMIDVAQLLEDSETKTEALEKVAELEDELSHVRVTSPVLSSQNKSKTEMTASVQENKSKHKRG